MKKFICVLGLLSSIPALWSVELCALDLRAEALKQEIFADKSARVLSLYAGSAYWEGRLAAELGVSIDAVDFQPQSQVQPGIRFILQDLVKNPRLNHLYDRIILLSPWIDDPVISTIREGPMKVSLTLRQDQAPVSAAFTAFAKLARESDLFSSATQTFGKKVDAGNFRRILVANISLSYERLQKLNEIIGLSRDQLNEKGEIILVTELIHTIAMSDSGATTSDNLLFESPIYSEIALKMLQESFPDLQITQEPALVHLLLGQTGKSQNPWGRKALMGWRIRRS
jgi:hypothetical protein